jgi:cell division protein FtsZ
MSDVDGMQERITKLSREDANKLAEEQEKAAKREERRGQFYGDSETNKRYKRRPNIYIFRPEDLDNDDIISAVEQTPTYKRTREILESIGQPIQVQETTKSNDSQPQDVQGVISFV